MSWLDSYLHRAIAEVVILTVQGPDLVVSVAVTAVVGTTFLLLRKELVYLAFDPDGARAADYPVVTLGLVVLVAVEAAVVTSVPAARVMLSVGLIVAPAAAARVWTDPITTMHAIAVALAIGSGLAGLELSRRFDVAAGGAITLVATAAFAFSWLVAPKHGAINQLRFRSHRKWRRTNPHSTHGRGQAVPASPRTTEGTA